MVGIGRKDAVFARALNGPFCRDWLIPCVSSLYDVSACGSGNREPYLHEPIAKLKRDASALRRVTASDNDDIHQ